MVLEMNEKASNQIKEAYELAKMMHGKAMEKGYDDTYIEKYLPPHIVSKLWEQIEWTDEQGYIWSFYRVCVGVDEQGVYISYAGKCDGQGYHAERIYRPDKGMYDIKYSS